jgi:hypothetical protein
MFESCRAHCASLGLRSSRGRRDTQPPTQAEIAHFIALADQLTPPSLAAYLDVGVHEGDAKRRARRAALGPDRLPGRDDPGRPAVERARARRHAAEARLRCARSLSSSQRASGCCACRASRSSRSRRFRGSHYRPSSRSHHWNYVRCGAGLGKIDLYTATRHYFGWYAWNVLELDARDIALHFGHQDGGELVRKLYGHPDAAIAPNEFVQPFEARHPPPVPLAAAAG